MREWLEGCCREFSREVALVAPEAGQRISFRDLPDWLRRRAEARGWAGPGWLLCPGGTDLSQVLDLLAAAWSGARVCPISPRWPTARALAWWKNILPEPWSESASLEGAGRYFREEAPGTAGGTVLATSGSTGVPKAVFHSWEAHIAAATFSAGPGRRIPLEPGDVWKLDFSPAHVSGLGILLRCLANGATVLLGEGGRVTHRSLVVTTLHRALLEANSEPPAKVALVGGGPVPARLVQEAVRRGWPVQTTYGMTETSAQICTSERWTEAALDQLAPSESGAPVGSVLPGREMKSGEDGKILARGAGLFDGYGQQGRIIDAARDADGWFDTGDLGLCAADGTWRILGRADRRFKSGGENISPEVIETALLGLPGVEAAVVLPVPDPEYGLRPVVFLHGRGAVAGWREGLRAQVSGLEMPVRWLRWPEGVDPLSGKWSRDLFQQILAREARGSYRLAEHS